MFFGGGGNGALQHGYFPPDPTYLTPPSLTHSSPTCPGTQIRKCPNPTPHSSLPSRPRKPSGDMPPHDLLLHHAKPSGDMQPSRRPQTERGHATARPLATPCTTEQGHATEPPTSNRAGTCHRATSVCFVCGGLKLIPDPLAADRLAACLRPTGQRVELLQDLGSKLLGPGPGSSEPRPGASCPGPSLGAPVEPQAFPARRGRQSNAKSFGNKRNGTAQLASDCRIKRPISLTLPDLKWSLGSGRTKASSRNGLRIGLLEKLAVKPAL